MFRVNGEFVAHREPLILRFTADDVLNR